MLLDDATKQSRKFSLAPAPLTHIHAGCGGLSASVPSLGGAVFSLALPAPHLPPSTVVNRRELFRATAHRRIPPHQNFFPSLSHRQNRMPLPVRHKSMRPQINAATRFTPTNSLPQTTNGRDRAFNEGSALSAQRNVVFVGWLIEVIWRG